MKPPATLRPSFNWNDCNTPHRDFLRFRNANVSWKAEVILDPLHFTVNGRIKFILERNTNVYVTNECCVTTVNFNIFLSTYIEIITHFIAVILTESAKKDIFCLVLAP